MAVGTGKPLSLLDVNIYDAPFIKNIVRGSCVHT